MNSRNKLASQIGHHNYQTWHFSISYALPMIFLINEFGIVRNLEI